MFKFHDGKSHFLGLTKIGKTSEETYESIPMLPVVKTGYCSIVCDLTAGKVYRSHSFGSAYIAPINQFYCKKFNGVGATLNLVELDQDERQVTTGWRITDNILVDVHSGRDLAAILKATLLSFQEFHTSYTEENYYNLLTSTFAFPDDEKHHINNGPKLLKERVEERVIHVIPSLLSALESNGIDGFYQEFKGLLSEDVVGQIHNKNPFPFGLNTFVAISQFSTAIHVLDQDYGVGPISIEIRWLKWLVLSEWRSNVADDAHKSPKLQYDFVQLITDLPRYVDQNALTAIDGLYPLRTFKEDQLYIDSSAFKAGLSQKTVDRVLSQYDKAMALDVIRYLTKAYQRSDQVQREKELFIEGRYNGFARLLSEETQTSVNIQRLKDACTWLDGLRYGTGSTNKVKFFTFEGLERKDELFAIYGKGFTSSISESNRLVPILEHPMGGTNSRKYYLRLGFALAALFVDKSLEYYLSGGEGITIDDELIRRLQNQVGYGRKSRFNEALRRFENEGAIIINNDRWKLGEQNTAGEAMILEGAALSDTNRERQKKMIQSKMNQSQKQVRKKMRK